MKLLKNSRLLSLLVLVLLCSCTKHEDPFSIVGAWNMERCSILFEETAWIVYKQDVDFRSDCNYVFYGDGRFLIQGIPGILRKEGSYSFNSSTNELVLTPKGAKSSIYITVMHSNDWMLLESDYSEYDLTIGKRRVIKRQEEMRRRPQ